MQEKTIYINGEPTDYTVRDDGTVWSNKRHRELKGTLARNAYHTVYLMFHGEQKCLMVHRLVAEAFCPNPNGYTIVHHKDENKLNNRADNLEWVTSQENAVASVPSRKPYKAYDKQLADPQKEWRVLSCNENYLINNEGEVANKKTLTLLHQADRNGYKRVNLQDTLYSVHRLVYETFIGPIPEGMKVDHIDGNRSNNNVANLRLVTQSDNMHAAMTNGHSGQVPVLQFDKDWNFIQEFPNIQAAADAVHRTHPAIRSAIERGGKSAGYYWKRKSEPCDTL